MTINPVGGGTLTSGGVSGRVNDDITPTRIATKNNKLVMQVNRYVPHYQRIPAKLTKNDFKMFME